MEVKNNRSVLVVFDDLTEFYAIQPDIDRMIKRDIQVDIFVVPSYSQEMHDDTKRGIEENGYKIIDEVKDRYKILLEPYPLMNNVNAEFRIKYQYGLTASSVKPNPVYTPGWSMPFDATVCYSFIEKSVFSVYTKAHLIQPLQFSNFKLHKEGKKRNLLVLFTWGDTRATQKLVKIKEQLGDTHNVIVKVHHAVQYRPDHQGIVEKLKSIADEYYDATENVNLLFNKADVVLSDNSSAIFTAIYLGIPVAIYSEAKKDDHKLGGLRSGHFTLLIEPKLIPYTNKLAKAKEIIDNAYKNKTQQSKLRETLFPQNVRTTLTDVVEEYLSLNKAQDPYFIVRGLLNKLIQQQTSQLSNQEAQITQLQSTASSLSEEINSHFGIKRSAKLLAGNIKRRIIARNQ